MTIDLTTIGAATPLPPLDHPIFKQPEIPLGLETTSEKMALDILALERRIAELERKQWTQLIPMLWRTLRLWPRRRQWRQNVPKQ